VTNTAWPHFSSTFASPPLFPPRIPYQWITPPQTQRKVPTSVKWLRSSTGRKSNSPQSTNWGTRSFGRVLQTKPNPLEIRPRSRSPPQASLQCGFLHLACKWRSNQTCSDRIHLRTVRRTRRHYSGSSKLISGSSRLLKGSKEDWNRASSDCSCLHSRKPEQDKRLGSLIGNDYGSRLQAYRWMELWDLWYVGWHSPALFALRMPPEPSSPVAEGDPKNSLGFSLRHSREAL